MKYLSNFNSAVGIANGASLPGHCNCAACIERRVPPSEQVRFYDDWGRKIAAELSAKLPKGWTVKWVDWDDPSRVKGSCWGSNITDFRQQIFKDGRWLSCFVIGTENFDPTGVYLTTKDIPLVWRDPKTGDAVPLSLYELLKNAGKYFAHKGVPPNCDLSGALGPDQPVFFREQMTIFMVPRGEEIKTRFTGRNYGSSQGRASNVVLVCSAQDVDAQLDDTVKGEYATPYMVAQFDPKTGLMMQQYTMADATKRSIAQAGTETKAEALAAIAEGKSAEVRLGPGKKSSGLMTIQVPILDDVLRREADSPARKKQKAAAAASAAAELAKITADAEAQAEAELDDDDDDEVGYKANWALPCAQLDDEAVRYRSCAADVDDEELPVVYRGASSTIGVEELARALPEVEHVLPPDTKLRMARFYASRDAAGVQRAMLGTNLRANPTGGVVTVTKTLAAACEPSQVVTAEDVVQLVKLMIGDLQHAVHEYGGRAENLMSDFSEEIGHTTSSLGAAASAGTDFEAGPNKLPEGLFDDEVDKTMLEVD